MFHRNILSRHAISEGDTTCGRNSARPWKARMPIKSRPIAQSKSMARNPGIAGWPLRCDQRTFWEEDQAGERMLQKYNLNSPSAGKRQPPGGQLRHPPRLSNHRSMRVLLPPVWPLQFAPPHTMVLCTGRPCRSTESPSSTDGSPSVPCSAWPTRHHTRSSPGPPVPPAASRPSSEVQSPQTPGALDTPVAKPAWMIASGSCESSRNGATSHSPIDKCGVI